MPTKLTFVLSAHGPMSCQVQINDADDAMTPVSIYEVQRIDSAIVNALTVQRQVQGRRETTAQCLYNRVRRSFLRGFVHRAYAAVKAWMPEVIIDVVDHLKVPDSSTLNFEPNNNLKLVRLQPWALDVMAQHVRGVIQLPTRFGKSYLYAGWWLRMGRPKTVIFAPTSQICLQMSTELGAALGEPVGTVAESSGIVTNWQQLTIVSDKSLFDAKRGLRREHESQLASVQAVIHDEAHKFSDLRELSHRFMSSLYWCFASSATPYTGDEYHDAILEGYTGPDILKAKAKDLAAYGYVASLTCRWIRLNKHVKGIDDWQENYTRNVVENEERNRIIASICRQHTINDGLRGIVFVDRVAHGEELLKLLPEARFVSSSVITNKESQAVLKQFNSGEIQLVIATKKWREGVTMYADFVVNAEAGKADHVTIQKAGRALMPRPDGSEVAWYDFLDEGEGRLNNQALSRLECMKTEGWPNAIIPTT